MALRFAFVAAGILTASTASAEPSSGADAQGTLAYVELVAPDGCGTRDIFMDSIRRQSETVRFVDRARAQRSLFAEIRPTPSSGFTAAFTLVQSSGRASQRQIAAKTCSEALEALTLLAALALDPREDEGPPAPPSKVEPPRPDAPVPSPAAPPSIGPTPRASERPPSVSAGVGGLAAFGSTPEAMPGAFLYAGGAWYGRGLWSPALRLTAAHAVRDGIQRAGVSAGFALDFIGLDLCPVAAGPPRWTVRACAQGTWGQFSANGGSDTRNPTNSHRPFGTLGGSLELVFDPGLRLEIVGRLGAGVPLVRDSLLFGPDPPIVFFRVQPVTLTAGLGVGFRIL